MNEEFPTMGEFEERKVGAISMFVPPGFSDHNVVAKIREQEIEKVINDHTEQRTLRCISEGCGSLAHVWVRDVRFFIGDDQILSSAGLGGDLPGFCFKHEGEFAPILAEWVFNNDPAMSIGVQPDRWEIRYTDGTRRAGIIAARNVVVKDEHTKGTDYSAPSDD